MVDLNMHYIPTMIFHIEVLGLACGYPFDTKRQRVRMALLPRGIGPTLPSAVVNWLAIE